MKKLLIVLATLFVFPAQAREMAIDLFNFSGGSGYDPQGGVIAGSDGTLYGMTSIGGSGACTAGAGCGTVYALSPPAQQGASWTMNVLYNFQGKQDGSVPQSQLVQDSSGALYGYTSGGTFGTVFRLTPPAAPGSKNWTFKILYVFTNGADGNLEGVYGPLVISDGSLYGVASGGTKGFGSVFRLTPDGSDNWTETTLYSFKGMHDGGNPNWIAGLDSSGALFVSTSQNAGLVARFTPGSGNNWKEQVIDRGHHPSYLLLNDDSVFGIDSAVTRGIVFQLVPPAGRASAWTKQKIASVSERRYGPNSLAHGPGGTLVGAIFGDFDFYPGSIFQLTPPSGSGSWTYSLLCGFARGPDRNPVNAVSGLDGHVFGVMNGGDSTSGSLFEVP